MNEKQLLVARHGYRPVQFRVRLISYFGDKLSNRWSVRTGYLKDNEMEGFSVDIDGKEYYVINEYTFNKKYSLRAVMSKITSNTHTNE